MKLIIFAFVFGLFNIAYCDEDCSNLVYMCGTHWSLTKYYSEPDISSATVDKDGNLYYVVDKNAYIFTNDYVKGKKIESGLIGKNVTDVWANGKGDVYIATEKTLFVLETTKRDITREVASQKTDIFKSIIADNDGIVYFLNGNKLVNIVLSSGLTTYVEDLDDVEDSLAVDKYRNFFYRNYEGKVVFYDRVRKYNIKGLESKKVVSIATDAAGNAFFASDDGFLYEMLYGQNKATKIIGLNVPKIIKVFVNEKGYIYLVSNDYKYGGVYVLKD